MKLRYIRAFIVLLAGLITLIVNMKTGKETTLSLFLVLIVIMIFYVIGTLVVEILQKALMEPKASDLEENSEIEEMISEDTEQNDVTESGDGDNIFTFEEDMI